MSDLATMLWKETAEMLGNRRFLRIFALSVLAMGVLPALSFSRGNEAALAASPVVAIARVAYVLFATAAVVAQTAPDLVLHERVGHTLDYLLTTRLPDWAIFGAKVLVASAVGYAGALIASAVQLIATMAISGTGWHWLFLGLPQGRIAALALTADLSLYVAVIGTFVALRVGEQRAAYMVTILAVGLLTVPFLLRWLHVALTVTWTAHAAIWFAAVALALGVIGLLAFRREMLALYLQE